MAGKFEIYEDKAGKFRWHLKAGNGEIIAQGQAYASEDGARRAVELVRSTAADRATLEQGLVHMRTRHQPQQD
jgi:uncharacterized protein